MRYLHESCPSLSMPKTLLTALLAPSQATTCLDFTVYSLLDPRSSTVVSAQSSNWRLLLISRVQTESKYPKLSSHLFHANERMILANLYKIVLSQPFRDQLFECWLWNIVDHLARNTISLDHTNHTLSIRFTPLDYTNEANSQE